MRFDLLTMASMKMVVFQDTAMCGLVQIDQYLSEASCLHHEGNEQVAHRKDGEVTGVWWTTQSPGWTRESVEDRVRLGRVRKPMQEDGPQQGHREDKEKDTW